MGVNANVDVDEERQLSQSSADTRHMFGFQALDVYRCAVRFLALAMQRAAVGASGTGGIPDQLRRGALSIPLNIAEGTGRFGKDQRRFYVTARGSALECAAILDAIEVLVLAVEPELSEPRELLVRVVSMLTKMIRVDEH